MILISAMSKDRVIGSGDGMPWSVAEEYQQFLQFIDGQTVMMGRRSYEIFGPDLTSAHTIVISRSGVDAEGIIVCSSIAEAVETAESFGKTVFSAGGATIYQQTMPLADTMYLSFIKGAFSGDTYFPAFGEDEWQVAQRRDHAEFEFVEYKRK